MSSFLAANVKIRPRQLALILAGVGGFLTVFLAYPLSQVFNGDWKLKQSLNLIENAYFDFNAFGLAFLAPRLGMEEIVPIGDIDVRFYSILIVIGLLSGYFMTVYLARLHYIANTIIDRLVIGLVIFGLIGARLFFVIFKWEFFESNPLLVLTEIHRGGLAIFGMMIGSGTYLWLYCKQYRFKFYEMLDILAPGVLLGQIIGRWGNFFNYEGYGPETNVAWRMFVPDSAIYYDVSFTARYFHPTFLYEIVPNFILLLILLWNYDKLTEKHAGRVFAVYAIGYGLIRFVTEFFRLDSLKLYLPEALVFKLGDFGPFEYLMVSQLMALAFIIIGITVWMRRGKYLFLKKNLEELKIF
jgi:phosphatidylglycerol---prolipoprotein diacylglyceryl transferase